ncbi:alpha/beta fold hydrolase [Streptosporangium sp. NPDC001559]|uniref:alpha/beta fold hydrolase n=1 Tax=Streptosporangium sp. NPDC001559 TaxID=3366187 RepID=UPI0036E16F12
MELVGAVDVEHVLLGPGPDGGEGPSPPTRRRSSTRSESLRRRWVGIDMGTPVAFLLAMRRPSRVRRLVLLEAILGELPGAGDLRPWWFGFHTVPGLAETVLTGHEAEYVGDLLERQLRPIIDDLTGHLIDDCGHIIPLDRPDALLPLLLAFIE